MLRRFRLPVGILVLTLIGFYLMGPFRTSRRAEHAESATAVAPARRASFQRTAADHPPSAHTDPPVTEADLPPLRQRVGPPGPVQVRADQPIPEIFPHQAERDAVQALVTTYDAARIPEIARYLSHEDATVRDAARLGLVQLGHRDAIPFLKVALKRATVEESEQLRNDIDFLSLPAATIPP